MHPDTVRVVYDNQPYLVVRREDGGVSRAYGPFAPGTEPSLVECTPETEVRSEATLATLRELLPRSPQVPSNKETLDGS